MLLAHKLIAYDERYEWLMLMDLNILDRAGTLLSPV